MDKHLLRATILKIEDRLTDNDRQRLHFYLGDDVPRRIRDDATLRGTLNLMDTLIDRDKINGKDLNLLIDAFTIIQCTDAVRLLTEYWQCNQSIESLSMIMPPLRHRSLSDAEDDKYPTKAIEKSMLMINDQREPTVISKKRWKYSILIILLLAVGYGFLLFFSVRNLINTVQIQRWHDKSKKFIETLKIRVMEFEKKMIQLYRWETNGTTIVGDGWSGNLTFGLDHPHGLHIDDYQTIYITDTRHHRILAYKKDTASIEIVAGGNGLGNRTNRLNKPVDVVFDSKRNILIICDQGNQRVIDWPHYPRMHNSSLLREGEIRLHNIDCWGLAIDHHGLLYVSDYKKHEVRRYDFEDIEGTIVAGGHEAGDALRQLEFPTFLFVDQYLSVYVADSDNDRVMLWKKDAIEGIVVAGGHGSGESLAQLSFPQGIWVDQRNNVYVADSWNDRVMLWQQGMRRGVIVAGGHGRGSKMDQLENPHGLVFDQFGNIYVADCWNHRVQRFSNRMTEKNR